MHNLLEPAGLMRHFQAHPPQAFRAWRVDELPVFSAQYDLLTTLEPAVKRRIEGLPLARWWRRALTPHTCFVGLTCTEYAPLPDIAPERLLHDLLDAALPDHAFVIVKDLPTDATLVGADALAHSQALLRASAKQGFFRVAGQALAHVPIDFDGIEEFLARMSRTRRKDLKRKLRSRAALTIETLATGDPRFLDPALLEEYYALYLAVFQQSEVHFDLLTPEFFRAVLQDASLDGVVFAYHAAGELIGYNLCFIHEGRLLDKYVGFRYPQARMHDLYTVSWFHNLEYALERGLTHYVAGWTDPEIKRHLGASFTLTQHAVLVRNPLLRRALQPFKRWFEADASWQQQAHR